MKDRHTKGNRKRKPLHSSVLTFCINCVFERNPVDGLYTEEALLYQNILEYFNEEAIIEEQQGRLLQITSGESQTVLANKRVNTWNLTKWLLTKNIRLKEYYSSGDERYMTNDTKIRHRIETIQRRVKDLTGCKLLKEVAMEHTKNGQLTHVYALANDGIMILWLMKYNNSRSETDKHKMEKILFQLIQAHYSRVQSYIGDFVSRLYLRSDQKGFASHMLRILLKTIHSNTHVVNRLNDALDAILQDHVVGLQTRKTFLNIYLEVLKGLHEDQRKIILHHEKTNIEDRIRLSRPPKEWEELWVQNINNYSKLVLYGKCKDCLQIYPVIIDYADYRMRILNDNGILRINCNKCSSPDALEIYNEASIFG